MTQKAKAPVLILIVLIIVSLALAGGVYYLLQQEKAKTVALKVKLDDLEAMQKQTESKLRESQKLISSLENKLQEATSQIDKLAADLEQEKSAKQEALAQIEQVRVDLEKQKGLRSDLEAKLNRAQEDVKKMQMQLNTLEAKKTELENKVKELEPPGQKVELGTIVVSPETAAAEAKAPVKKVSAKEKKAKALPSVLVEGNVLVINKDYNFAVINLGSKDRVGAGDLFAVYHNNRYVGDVKVEKVHDAMSAAAFTSEEAKNKITEGDKVVQKAK